MMDDTPPKPEPRAGWPDRARHMLLRSLPGRLALLVTSALLAGWLVVRLIFPDEVIAEGSGIELCSPPVALAARQCQSNAPACQIAIEQLLRKADKISAEDSVRSVVADATDRAAWTTTVARSGGGRTAFRFDPCHPEQAEGMNY